MKPKVNVATPHKTNEILRKHKLIMKKSLGQNFLVDANILNRIVHAAELGPAKGVIEIGPGIGALTERLAEAAGQVVALEIDQRLLPALQETVGDYDHVNIIHGDVLKVDLRQIMRDYFPDIHAVSVVANLPYYITTPIVMKLLEERLPLEYLVMMVQKEVAERMTARPGGKQYGSLSIAVQYYCEAKTLFTVPGTVFIPPPNVDSAVIRLRVRGQPAIQTNDPDRFFAIVRASFTQRRKTIYNNLRAAYPALEAVLKAWLSACGIDPARRAETLSMEEFAVLSAHWPGDQG